MIEEAAGTKMFDAKRDNSMKLIEKKELKMRDIEHVRSCGEGEE